MSALRGFGMTMDFTTGTTVKWYVDASGRKRCAATDAVIVGRDPDAKRSQRDDAYIAEMQKIVPPMRPDDLEASEGICALQSDNTDIQVSQWAYADIANTESDLKGSHDDDRR